MSRKIAVLSALSMVATVGMASPASAQTYAGITLSFGSGYDGYGSDPYEGDYDSDYPDYNYQTYPDNDYYYSPSASPDYYAGDSDDDDEDE